MLKYRFENHSRHIIHLDCLYSFISNDEEIGKTVVELIEDDKFIIHALDEETQKFYIRLTLRENENVKFNEKTKTPHTVIMGDVGQRRDEIGTYAIVPANE
ncbi:MAG TPA: hypothetical protein VGB00_00320 [Pyrinomonadaceae bacterium]|jgi:hypothetical protein